jgi:CRP/FNR family transcriptional regulator, cyclic AMP receptor protein
VGYRGDAMPDGSARLEGLGALLPAACWHELLKLGVPRTHEPGTVLMRQGNEGHVVLALVHGRVKISTLEVNGVEMTFTVRGPGEVLGDIAALNHGPRTATVTTVDHCTAYEVKAAQFARFLMTPSRFPMINKVSHDRLAEAEQYRRELATLPLPQRACRALARLSTPCGENRAVIDLGLSQEELGRIVGAHRNSVGTVLTELRDLGVIGVNRERVDVHDVRTLREYAEHGLPRRE